jgi:hypothetical protein
MKFLLFFINLAFLAMPVEGESGESGLRGARRDEEDFEKAFYFLLFIAVLGCVFAFLYCCVLCTVRRLEGYLDRVSFQRELKQAENRILENVSRGIFSKVPPESKPGTKQEDVASLNIVVSYFDDRRDPTEHPDLSPMIDCFSSLTMTLRPHLAPSCYTVKGFGAWKDGPFRIVHGMFCSKTGVIFWVEKPADETGIVNPRELLFTGKIRHFGIGGMWVLDHIYWKALHGGQGNAVSSYDPNHLLNAGFAQFFWKKTKGLEGLDDDTIECSEDSEEEEEESAAVEVKEDISWNELVDEARKQVLGDHVDGCPLSQTTPAPHDLEEATSTFVSFTTLYRSCATPNEDSIPFQFENVEVMKCAARNWNCENCHGKHEDSSFFVLGNHCTRGALTPQGKAYWVQDWCVVADDQILVVGAFVFQKGECIFEGRWRSQSGGHGTVTSAGDVGMLSSLLEEPLQDEDL